MSLSALSTFLRILTGLESSPRLGFLVHIFCTRIINFHIFMLISLPGSEVAHHPTVPPGPHCPRVEPAALPGPGGPGGPGADLYRGGDEPALCDQLALGEDLHGDENGAMHRSEVLKEWYTLCTSYR